MVKLTGLPLPLKICKDSIVLPVSIVTSFEPDIGFIITSEYSPFIGLFISSRFPSRIICAKEDVPKKTAHAKTNSFIILFISYSPFFLLFIYNFAPVAQPNIDKSNNVAEPNGALTVFSLVFPFASLNPSTKGLGGVCALTSQANAVIATNAVANKTFFTFIIITINC